MQVALVRAFRGEPLCRTVIECGERVIYLSHPDKVAAVQAGYSFPIGFPSEDVFNFELQLYERLRSQWDHYGKIDQSLWNEATPFGMQEG